jgi:transposase InsO family protein
VPWKEVSIMEQRREFVRLASQPGANIRELCRRFEISPPTGYKILARWRSGDLELADRSRRPHTSPGRSSAKLEARVLQIRDEHPVWGARKIVEKLQGIDLPSVSTVHQILVRHGRIGPTASQAKALTRFEAEAPNRLWQMDYKGWIPLIDDTPCHPLTIVDDHSRFSPCLRACLDQRGLTVKQHLQDTFRRYGLPDAIYVDNGTPWGSSSLERWTKLTVWLLKYGVDVIYSRPYHPQGRGKNERFHRTLKAEVFALQRFRTIGHVQKALDAWREVYNFERPHQALGMTTPASRYRPSSRSMPSALPQVEYDEGEIVRLISRTKSYVSFRGQLWRVPKAFRGERVAIRPLDCDGAFGVFFAARQIATIDCP